MVSEAPPSAAMLATHNQFLGPTIRMASYRSTNIAAVDARSRAIGSLSALGMAT
jgi:hypothetical protein